MTNKNETNTPWNAAWKKATKGLMNSVVIPAALASAGALGMQLQGHFNKVRTPPIDKNEKATETRQDIAHHNTPSASATSSPTKQRNVSLNFAKTAKKHAPEPLARHGKIKLPGFTNGKGPHKDTFAVSPAVEKAVKKAAKITENSEEFLYRVYARESTLNPHSCKNKKGPCGLAQFQPATFMEFIYKYKDKLPQKHAALYAQVKRQGKVNWQYVVADKESKQDLLNLRMNPDVAAILGGLHMNENFSRIKKHFPTKITAQFSHTEKYIAGHFLGVKGGKDFLKYLNNSQTTQHAAKDYLKKQAEANIGIFYYTNRNGDKKPRSFRQIYDKIERQITPLPQQNKIQLSQNSVPSILNNII